LISASTSLRHVAALVAFGLSAACGEAAERAGAEAGPPSAAVAEPVPSADLHVHIGTQASADLIGSIQPTSARDSTTAEDAIAALDEAGIERGLVLSLGYLFGGRGTEGLDEEALVRAENDYVVAQVAGYADRLVAACSVNPLKEYALKEIQRCFDDLGVRTLKLHFTNSDVDLRLEAHVDRLRQVWSMLAAKGGFAIVHMRTGAEDYGARDAREFIDGVLAAEPGVPVHIAHMAGWGGYDDATDSALGEFVTALDDGRLDRGSIWFGLGAVVFQPEAAGQDTALARVVREANETLVDRIRELGTDRVTYATDWPGWPPVPDASQGISANVRLIRGSLGLEDAELTAVFANAGLLGSR